MTTVFKSRKWPGRKDSQSDGLTTTVYSGADLNEHDDREQAHAAGEHEPLRVYKRRFFGLTQLVLLNIVVSWDVSNSSSPYGLHL